MSAFYESIGELLSQAGQSLASDEGPGLDSERRQRELRQIVALLRRTGAIWTQLFDALSREIETLETTLQRANAVASEHALTAVLSPAPGNHRNPLERHRQVQRDLDQIVEQLCERADQAWAVDALAEARRGLAAAAEIQGELVDAMLAA